MGILDRLLGRTTRRDEPGPYGRPVPGGAPAPAGGAPAWGTPPSAPQGSPYPPEPGAPSPDQARQNEEAIRRYRYLLRTAPPDAVEQAHAEAFAHLTPDQRRQVLGQLANHVPEYERSQDDDPRSLARMATRAELRQPGLLERVFGGAGAGRGYGPGYGGGYGPAYGGGGMMRGGMLGGGGMGMGMGGMIAGGLLASVAGSFIGTAIAGEMFDHDQYMASGFADAPLDQPVDGSGIDFDNQQVDTAGVDDRALADPGYDQGYGAGDQAQDFAGGDQGFGDAGGGDGGFGGDDLGGGDFGGGDFGGGGDW